MKNVVQDNSPSIQPIQHSSNIAPTANSSSRSKLKVIATILVIIILLISIGGYIIANTLSKESDCGADLDCFIKAAQSCNPATVSKTYALLQSGDLKSKITYEIKGQELEKCILLTKSEIEENSDSDRNKELGTTEQTREAIKQFEEEVAEQRKRGITCRFNRDELILAIKDLKIGKNTLNEKISVCTAFSQANNTKRRSDINSILNAVNQYTADNNGAIPNAIISSEQEISRSQADLCSFLVHGYLPSFPTDPKINDLPVENCMTPYVTGYTIFKDSSTNKITIRAPKAELGEKIEITR